MLDHPAGGIGLGGEGGLVALLGQQGSLELAEGGWARVSSSASSCSAS